LALITAKVRFTKKNAPTNTMNTKNGKVNKLTELNIQYII
jgi:hypothetical protein